MGTFAYHVVYRHRAPGPIVNLIAEWVESRTPLRAVLWNVPQARWSYEPGIAARTIYGDVEMEKTEPVDRATAERVARDVLGQELPTEEELHRICAEGASQATT
ncbi:hypothetical protein ACFQ1L_41820 [Phytohabitans flavus]|uniref:hypothetical protein n=1 Tax=Phytohabitans flavus TaxID=1076124 RepID=UPI00363E9B3D